MPFVRGYLRFGRRSGGRPDNSLPGEQPGIDNTLPEAPGGEIDNSLPEEQPGIDNSLPTPPPGIWPPPNPGTPVQPLPPEEGAGTPEQPIYKPGTIWPPVNGPKKKMLLLAYIPGIGYKYIVVDPSLKPDQGLPTPPTAQPKV